MRLGLFEDDGVHSLEPIALTRAAFSLRCGAGTLLERQRRTFGADQVGAWVRPELAELTRRDHPGMAINDKSWRSKVWVNARWLPTLEARLDCDTPHVGLVGDSVAYVVGAPGDLSEWPGDVGVWLNLCQDRLPHVPAGGKLIEYLWDAVDHNGRALGEDWAWFQREHAGQPVHGVAVVGPAERLVIAPGASIEPYVTADTRQGPVLIDRGAVVHSFSRLEGPCYVGAESWIVGAKLRGGSSIGPHSRIGGEVEASIVQGRSNKYHDGFLGHSYIGEWVNLAAATQTSDLRNDYGVVRLTVNGERLSTGRTKIGSYIGDHTKTGLGALLNTGSVIGVFCNLLSSGTLLPGLVPSFCQVQHGSVQERFDMRQMFATAAIATQRRGCELTEAHLDFFYTLYDQTAERRRKTVQEAERRRLRKSV